MNAMGVSRSRRLMIVAGFGVGACLIVRPALATSGELAAAVNAYAGGAPIKAGRVKLDIAPLVDNGNTVPLSVSVDSPMTAADHVVAIAVFNERNPQREVIKCTLGSRAGRASISTRIRLATSQKLVAVARMSDGTYWSDTVDVIVSIAACLENPI